LFFEGNGTASRVVRYSKTIVGPDPVQIDYPILNGGGEDPVSVAFDVTSGQSMFSLTMKPNVAIDPAKFAKTLAAAKPVVAPAKVREYCGCAPR
jgi:hypothetical protein